MTSPPPLEELAIAIQHQQAGRLTEAIGLLKQLVETHPDFAEAHNNLGSVLQSIHQLEQASAAFERAIELRPDNAVFLQNLASSLLCRGDAERAASLYRQAIALDPELPDAHYGLGLSLLTIGDFASGWIEHEWRWKVQRLGLQRPPLRQPLWDGAALNGRRILIYAEQGFGDAIHFARYLPMVAARGGVIHFACRPELARLMQTIGGIERIESTNSVQLDFDVHCPLMSLPGIMGTRLDNIPANVPYLRADREKIEQWRSRLKSLNPSRRKVGLVWSGNPELDQHRARSMALAALTRLAELSSRIELISLQKGAAAGETKSPSGLRIHDWTDELQDFSDTAALIENLDLVLTVDTAVAHLSGALGRPTWILLSRDNDWRWMLHREDSAWYPTVRLFRQQVPGDWSTPVDAVVCALGEF